MSSHNQLKNCRSVPHNVYYLQIPLFVLDVVRMFQDHPKYKTGLQQTDIVDILHQETFANGDLTSQIETAVRGLETSGFIRYVVNGYRTLGPLARITTAKTPRQRAAAWDGIQEEYSI